MSPARPLVLNTRPAGQAADLTDHLRALGLDVVEAPTTRVVAACSPEDARRMAERVRAGAYDWVVVPSANAAQFWLDALAGTGVDATDLRGTRLLCGTATAKVLERVGLRPTQVLERFSATEALNLLAKESISGVVLVSRALGGRDELVDGLRSRGVEVDAVPLYRTEPVEPSTLAGVAELLRGGTVAAVTLTSPSGLDGLIGGLAALGDDPISLLCHTRLVCIGSTTAAAVHAHGLPVAAIAERTSAASLADAVARVVSTPGRMEVTA